MNYKTLDDLNRVIELGKPKAVLDVFFQSYQEGLQYEAFLKAQKEAYLAIYPETKNVVEKDEDGNETTKVEVVDYSEVEGYLPFEEWLQEREVITYMEPKQDLDGNEWQEEVTRQGDLLRPFVVGEITAKLEDLKIYVDYVNKPHLDYLASTDWYITRLQETGREVPVEVITKRQEARDSII